jgi:Xaa-Pro dipeptidase
MNSGSVHAKRLGKLRGQLGKKGLRGVVMVPGPNMKYYLGVNSLLLERPFMLLVPVDGEPQLVAPTLEAGPYVDGSLPVAVHPWTDSEGSAAAIAAAVEAAGLKGRWGVEGRVPFQFLDKLTDGAPFRFSDAEPVLQGLREVKDESEVRLLKKAAAILSKSFEEFPSLLKVGRTELEVARAATDAIHANGGTRVDDMMVQSGPRAADPHRLPSARKLGREESIVVDVGAVYEGYYADMTRTFCLGASRQFEEVYEKVLEAETRAIEKAASGVRVGEVDGAARTVLEKAGMGKYFIHRTGHGLGLEVHEAPYIVEGGKEKLESNMCFTVEPGVYIRGKLGVRLEDDLLIEGKKGVAITDTPIEYGWWK